MCSSLLWILVFFSCFSLLAYHRASLAVWALGLSLLLVFYSAWAEASMLGLGLMWVCFFLFFSPLLFAGFRQRFITKPIFAFYRKIMPTMSRTEREALNAGTISWEGDLFSGQPRWQKLLAIPSPQLSEEEQAFLEGPVEELCEMIDDWDISFKRGDLPPHLWSFLKKQGFFGLMIPKEYGGKEFSNYACSQVQVKVQARSVTVGTTVSVPNSLGPAELLLHYGTPEQKAYYLPRLASGEEVPCFALTSPEVGSDATAMLDHGVVCKDKRLGKSGLGIRLNWDKRYITLAPVATVIGLAFKLYDPDHLLGEKVDLGITCALIPRKTNGITIGRRHYPLSAVFQNGPIQGKDVFIPLDYIIGGPERAGQGWKMLMECLAGGRAVSLPAVVTGASKAAVLVTGAYSRVRRQFKQAIVRFEGVAEVLGQMAGQLYLMEAARVFILSALDKGEKPALASAIVKSQLTEKARLIGNDAMDIQGGKGIMMGPRNLIGRSYEAIPIAITVEGANILTRNMIIFGQGAMRCHPYVFKEYQAARQKDDAKGLSDFDQAFFAHVGFAISNFFRSLVLGLTGAKLVMAPASSLKSYYQQLTRYSSIFALLADVAMVVYGKDLKRKESISARLGDLHSQLYLLSATLNYYHHDGERKEEYPVAAWACQTAIYEMELRIEELLQNLPFRSLAFFLRAIVFPWGRSCSKPSVALTKQVASLFSTQSLTRQRMTEGLFLKSCSGNYVAELELAFAKIIQAEPLEKLIRKAVQAGSLEGFDFKEQALHAMEAGLITVEQLQLLTEAESARQQVIAVDDFEAGELVRL